MADLNQGILYVATGSKYVSEAILSAKSVKKFGYSIALITDMVDYELPDNLFDFVIKKPAKHNYEDKLLMVHSPFVKTIFLDTDTYVCEPLDDLFKLLDFREFAIHQADEGYEFEMPELSNAMPEFNTGVIAYQLTPNVIKLMGDWKNSFQHNSAIVTDQYHLRKTLYESEVRFAIFSSAYNFIIYYPNFVIQKVKILHGRPFDLLIKVAADINNIRHKEAWRRMYYPYHKTHAIIYRDMKKEDLFNVSKFSLRTVLAKFKRKLKL